MAISSVVRNLSREPAFAGGRVPATGLVSQSWTLDGEVEKLDMPCAMVRDFRALPVIDREPLFYIEDGASPEGCSLIAVYGDQGPQVAGWLDRGEPRWAEGLHILEAIVRSPLALATLLEAAGPGAEEQVGRIRARRQRG